MWKRLSTFPLFPGSLDRCELVLTSHSIYNYKLTGDVEKDRVILDL